ncbi:MAG: septal ring lytic transglycosylase RlpA family protein [Alphaproteobacteria bacterium]|nr:septal ring lytic transglycosylase RlpA family protein [Alphaproteobacteria bacterium]
MIFLRNIVITGFIFGLAACSPALRHYTTSTPTNPAYKVGKPYEVAGKIYRPVYDPHYDRVGLASWYGAKFHGRRTANGDIFNMNALTAAHTTLPMPSYVRVTNLENGRWLILKINDRGPFVGNRLIDVSRRAAQLLGFEKKGVTRVRVQAVNGPQGQLPQQIQARKKPPPPPVTAAVQVMAAGKPAEPVRSDSPRQNNVDKKIYIQIGAFADRGNALKTADSIDHISPAKIDRVDINGQKLYRVRVGPQATVKLAEIILGRILSLGHNTAHIVRDH